jgi:hypothetical protein
MKPCKCNLLLVRCYITQLLHAAAQLLHSTAWEQNLEAAAFKLGAQAA